MSLYGRTDSNTNKTKVEYTIASDTSGKTIVFVDETEAALNENRVRGIDGPGWWSYFTYVDTDGNTRHKCEKLVALADPDTNANETQTDDTIAADVASAVTITGQPSAVTGASTPYTGTFAVTTSTTGTPGTLTYQWQYQTASQTTKWTNVANSAPFSGATTATLTLTAAAKATYDGYKFRVKINSAGGTEEVISNSASITYA